MRGEELKHRALLEEAYARQFPDVKAWYPRTILPTQSLAPRVDAAPVLSPSTSLRINSAEGLEGEMSVPELLALAMQAEQASERFYADLARRSQSESAPARRRDAPASQPDGGKPLSPVAG